MITNQMTYFGAMTNNIKHEINRPINAPNTGINAVNPINTPIVTADGMPITDMVKRNIHPIIIASRNWHAKNFENVVFAILLNTNNSSATFSLHNA